MDFDRQLREALDDHARGLPNDTDTALLAVRRVAARRRRERLVTAAIVAIVVLVAGGAASSRVLRWGAGETPDPAAPATASHQRVHSSGAVAGGTGDPLVGEWQSAVVTAQRLGAAMSDAGFGRPTTRRVLAGARTWVVQMTFGTTLTVETWSAADPSGSLRLSTEYAFRSLRGRRLVVRAFDSSARWSFSYRLSGDRLLLHYRAARRASADGLETARFVAWASAPMTLVHY
jgi:hypothetical protein